MKKQPDSHQKKAELLQRAEQVLSAQSDEVPAALTTNERKLFHELQVHQIELEMQNEALQIALTRADEARSRAEFLEERAAELFDFAPIAYFVLDRDSVIKKTNFSGAHLLGIERSKLSGQKFSYHLSPECKPIFNRFLDELFSSKTKQTAEIKLQTGETPCYLAIEATFDKNQNNCLLTAWDISGRKQNGEYHRETNAFMTSILNSLTSQISVLDEQGVIIAVNNAWIEFGKENGLPESNYNCLGVNYLDACKQNDDHALGDEAEAAYVGISRVLAGSHLPFSLEYPCQFADQQHWFRMTASPLKGSHYGAVVIHENITQRKLAERMPNLLKGMVDISLDGFVEFDLLGNLKSVNQAYSKISGYSMDELINMHISQLEIIENPEQIKSHIDRITEQGYDQFETCHRHKDGHPIDMEISAAFLPEYQRYCAFCRDISQRKQTEGKLQAIFDASVDGFISYDIYNRIVSVNPAVQAIFGYEPEELMGCNISTLMPSLPKCTNHCPDLPDVAKGTGQTFEIEGVHKNGFLVPLDISSAAYRMNNSCYFVSIVRDISTRKQREKLDKVHLDELAHVTRLGLMGEMASGIAHEINQPLTAINTYLQVFLNLINSERADLATLTEIARKSQQQALRAGQIIHHMRDFVRSSTKHRSTVDINVTIHEAVSLCTDDIKQNYIQLSLDLQNDLPLISANQVQIEQVLINLVRNSIDVLQTLPETRQRQLGIQTKLMGTDEIEVRVKDNGPGMDDDQKGKIMTPFYTSKTYGMGMGLSICKSLIEAHNGILCFNSKLGKGTTFYFTLPAYNKKGLN